MAYVAEMNKPVVLLTNDDGVESVFFHALVETLAPHCQAWIAVPRSEQSWGGRSFSRNRKVTVTKAEGLGAPGWVLDGTPSDCVNIALAHLLKERPQAVISGINIGYNTTLPLLYCSGTVAAALEGSLWGLHAVAASQMMNDVLFEEMKAHPGRVPASLAGTIRESARRTAEYTLGLLGSAPRPYLVHNLNFPVSCSPETLCETTCPADLTLGGLFQPDPNAAESTSFIFRFQPGQVRPNGARTDRDALLAGHASLSLLDFSRLATV